MSRLRPIRSHPTADKRKPLQVAEGSADAVRGRATEGYDFVEDRTRDGRKLRMLNVVDKFTRECLCVRVGRKLGLADVIDVLADLFMARGTPGYIRSDNVLYREAAGHVGQHISSASLH